MSSDTGWDFIFMFQQGTQSSARTGCSAPRGRSCRRPSVSVRSHCPAQCKEPRQWSLTCTSVTAIGLYRPARLSQGCGSLSILRGRPGLISLSHAGGSPGAPAELAIQLGRRPPAHLDSQAPCGTNHFTRSALARYLSLWSLKAV